MADNNYQKSLNNLGKEIEILNSKIRELEQQIRKSENAPYPTALEKEKSKTVRFYPYLNLDDKNE